MSKQPTQILPALDPDPPTTNERHSYYILTEPNSPSVAPEMAVEVVQYKRSGDFVQQFLHDDPSDFRRPWGYATYSRQLSFEEIDKYHLLHFDPAQRALFDMWLLFGKDRAKLLAFFKQLYKVVEGDSKRERLGLATKLLDMGWTLTKAIEAIKGIDA